MRASRRANATIAIFLPRRRSIACSQLRRAATRESEDRHTRQAAWTNNAWTYGWAAQGKPADVFASGLDPSRFTAVRGLQDHQPGTLLSRQTARPGAQARRVLGPLLGGRLHAGRLARLEERLVREEVQLFLDPGHRWCRWGRCSDGAFRHAACRNAGQVYLRQRLSVVLSPGNERLRGAGTRGRGPLGV